MQLRIAHLAPLLFALAGCPSGPGFTPRLDGGPRDLKPPADQGGAADLKLASDMSVPPDMRVPPDMSVPPDISVPPDLTVVPDLTFRPDLTPAPDLLQQTNTINTHNFMGMTEYPLDLDICKCCSGTTTQQEADAFCQLAGFTVAVGWTKAMIAGTNCYCWGACSNFKWLSNCCSGFTTRPMLTSITCQ